MNGIKLSKIWCLWLIVGSTKHNSTATETQNLMLHGLSLDNVQGMDRQRRCSNRNLGDLDSSFQVRRINCPHEQTTQASWPSCQWHRCFFARISKLSYHVIVLNLISELDLVSYSVDRRKVQGRLPPKKSLSFLELTMTRNLERA